MGRMARGRTSRARASWTKVLGLLALVPALLLGQILGGDALLVHAHGADGEHVHVVSELTSATHDHDHAHHGVAPAVEPLGHGSDGQCAGSDSSGVPRAPRQHEPQHEDSCVLISFPGPLHVTSLGSAPWLRPASEAVLRVEGEPRFQSRVAAPALTGAGPPGRERPGKKREGLLAVLASSRAILL